jgi:hypothetical protein
MLDRLLLAHRTLVIALLGGLVAAVAVSLSQAGAFDPALSLTDRARTLPESWAIRAGSVPFVVFSRALLATSAAELAAWSAAGLLAVMAVAWGILKLDHDFLEATLATSQRVYDAQQRARRGGGLPAIGATRTRGFKLPIFPRAGGAGPIAWRQALDLARGSGRLLFIVPAMIGPFMALFLRSQQAGPPGEAIVTGTLIVGVLIQMMIPLGLRSDLNHVEAIKPLPIGAGAVISGSIAAAALYVTLLQLIALVALSAVLWQWSEAAWLALALALPVNVLLLAIDGAMVILFPSTRRFAAGDLLLGLRMALTNLAKLLVGGVAAGLAALGALVAGWLSGESHLAMAAAACTVLWIEGAAMLGLAALLFAHLDATAHATDEA